MSKEYNALSQFLVKHSHLRGDFVQEKAVVYKSDLIVQINIRSVVKQTPLLTPVGLFWNLIAVDESSLVML